MDRFLFRFRRFLCPTALAALLAACTTTRERPISLCLSHDWFETGRQDGSLGRPLSELDRHRLQCQNSDNPPNLELYVAGRNLGLSEFCTPARARELGYTHGLYQGVCPEYLEAGFLSAMKDGERLSELESETARLRRRSEQIRAELSQAVSILRQVQLRAQLEDLDRRLQAVRDQMAALNADRAGLE